MSCFFANGRWGEVRVPWGGGWTRRGGVGGPTDRLTLCDPGERSRGPKIEHQQIRPGHGPWSRREAESARRSRRRAESEVIRDGRGMAAAADAANRHTQWGEHHSRPTPGGGGVFPLSSWTAEGALSRHLSCPH